MNVLRRNYFFVGKTYGVIFRVIVLVRVLDIFYFSDVPLHVTLISEK